MDEAIEELTHYLLPDCDGVWKEMAYQPPLQRDLYNDVFNQNGGTKQRTTTRNSSIEFASTISI